MKKQPSEKEAIESLDIYNEAQQWWVRIKDNCIAMIKQFEDSIKLQKEIQILAENKIKSLKS